MSKHSTDTLSILVMPHCYDSFQHLDISAKGAGRQVSMVTGNWETGMVTGNWETGMVTGSCETGMVTELGDR